MTRTLAYAVDEACTQQWASEQGRCAPPVRPVLSLLVEFCEERLNREAVKEDLSKAIAALADLRTAVSTIIMWGHAEFKPILQQIDGELLFIAKTAKHQLMAEYLNPKTSPARVKELYEIILDLASTGYWDSVREDMDNQLWDRAMATISSLRSERA